MVYGILTLIHVIVCIGLIGIVLIQAGRGGGLSETFSGAESIFGTKTNALLTRATSIFAVIFFITCLTLAFVSKQHSKSLIEGKKISTKAKVQETKPQEAPATTEPSKNTQAPQTQTHTESHTSAQGASSAQSTQAQEPANK